MVAEQHCNWWLETKFVLRVDIGIVLVYILTAIIVLLTFDVEG